jgi:CheY-like chemotaxis protein
MKNDKWLFSQSYTELPSQTELANIRNQMLDDTSLIIADIRYLLEFIDKHQRFQELFFSDIDKMLMATEYLQSLITPLFFNQDDQFDLKNLTSSKRHDLHTPINAMIAYCEMLLDDIDEDIEEDFDETIRTPAGAKLQNIMAIARRLMNLIDDVFIEAKTLLNEPPSIKSSQGPLLLTVYQEGCVLQRRLNRLGFEVEKAENGQDILHQIRHQTFDLLLLDMELPDMTAYHVLEVLKNEQRLNQLPVLLISSPDEIDKVKLCLEIGANDYLPKPFTSESLNDKVLFLLQNELYIAQ